MEWVIIVIIWVLFGLWCKSIAAKKNLDENVAFLVGLFLGLIAVLIYSFLSPKLDKK